MRILQPGETCYFLWEINNEKGHTWIGGIIQSYDRKWKRYTIISPHANYDDNHIPITYTLYLYKREIYFVRSHKPKKGIILPA